MNVGQAVATLRVSRRTLYYWMARGTLPFTEGPCRSRQLNIEDVMREVNKLRPHRRRAKKGRAA
jgi:predicted site-specific integrase-resolvase